MQHKKPPGLYFQQVIDKKTTFIDNLPNLYETHTHDKTLQ